MEYGSILKNAFIEPELKVDSKKANASYIRKRFRITKEVKSAVLAMTALGCYEGYLNGKRMGEQVLTPGYTDYRYRVQYQQYDVTGDLKQGENVIAALVGDGWYRGYLGIMSKRNCYGDKIKFAAALDIRYADGTREMIRTDESWKATQNGPLMDNDLKVLEVYDARKEMPGWNDTGFDDFDWHGVMRGQYEGEVVLQTAPEIREQEVFPAKILHTPDGNYVADFGQNLAGHVQFTVTGHAGRKIRIKMGEVLDADGNFTTSNLAAEGLDSVSGKLGQEVDYILKEGTQTYKSHFNISGYRYAILMDFPEEPKAENFKSIAIYSKMNPAGSFTCSNPMVNQLVENSRWSQHSNFVSVPTDCPTRERAGWCGDIDVYGETALYLSDAGSFLRKYLEDMVLEQRRNGSTPFLVPEGGYEILHFAWNSCGWSDVIANLPVLLYRFYGDKSYVEEFYEPAKKFNEFQDRRAKKRSRANLFRKEKYLDFIIDTGFHWGEWLEPGHVMADDIKHNLVTADAEVATAWYYMTTKNVAEMARILGKMDEAGQYERKAKRIREAYRAEFLKDGMVYSDRQCRYVRPVYMGLVDEEESKRIGEKLNDMVIANEYRIGTGFLTTWQVLQVLCDTGHTDTAYKMLEQTECPGWLYEVKKGATTTWENWFGIDEDGKVTDSHNHYAPGAVVAWLFSYCAGIRPLEPGFSKIEIKPHVGGTFTYAEGRHTCPYGEIVSRWEKKEDGYQLKVTIPDHTSAVVILPDGKREETGAGVHEYQWK